ncbi:hypothetical protein D3C76_1555790 [compost metagenome]
MATARVLKVPLFWASSSTACSLTESASSTCRGRSITTPQALVSAIGLTGNTARISSPCLRMFGLPAASCCSTALPSLPRVSLMLLPTCSASVL